MKVVTSTVETVKPMIDAKVPAPRPLFVPATRKTSFPKTKFPMFYTVTLQQNIPFSIQQIPGVKHIAPMAKSKPVSKPIVKDHQVQVSSLSLKSKSPRNPTMQDPKLVITSIPVSSSPSRKPLHTNKTSDHNNLLVSVKPSSSTPIFISLPPNVPQSLPQIGLTSQSLSNASPSNLPKDQSGIRKSPMLLREFASAFPTNTPSFNPTVLAPLLSLVPSVAPPETPSPATVTEKLPLAETLHPFLLPKKVVTTLVPVKSVVPIPDPTGVAELPMKLWPQHPNPQAGSPNLVVSPPTGPVVPMPKQSVPDESSALPLPHITYPMKVTTAPLTHGRQRKHGWIVHKSEEQNVDIANQGSTVENVMSSLAPTSIATNSLFQPQFDPQDSNVYTSQITNNRAFLQNSKQLVGGVTLIMLAVGISSWVCIVLCYHLHRRNQRKRLRRQTSSFGSL
jgi:hypothetical protein